ncbi:hypothetical protein DLAC_08194 [Tieghemostelium lacteum]|uniref:Uncharacterized protein n=1 Tax=Tieghemostelium lacteum TaxID=361077 RepID=A0A151ZBD6_TIELA|nr:hypothetical protein DLAC_08194 [Tieghemostelium lacteum]|eukprot:KYQ91260.1 hypothetical protein DLAC_08194 [Tieghemostelium lacteum]
MSSENNNYYSNHYHHQSIITSNNNNSSTYYSKNIKSISSEDYHTGHHKSISSENVTKKPYVKHYIPRNKRNNKINQNSHHFKSQQTPGSNSTANNSNNNMIKGISSDSYSSNGNTKQHENNKENTSPNKSRMKRLSLTVSVSTQKYLEKISKSDSTLDSEDIKKLKSLLRDQKQDVNKFTKMARSTVFATDKFNNGIIFGEGVFAFGEGDSLKDSPEGEAIRELGNQIQDIENSKKDSQLGSIQNLLEPIIGYYDQDIKKARELKRKQNVVRIRFEQAAKDLQEIRKKSDPYSSKTKQAKQEEETNRTIYNQVTKEFSETMVENDKKMKIELRKLIREYVQYQCEFYRECLDSWEEFAEDLEEILPSDNIVQNPLSTNTDQSPSTKKTSPGSKPNKKKKSSRDNDNDDEDDESNDDDLLNDL